MMEPTDFYSDRKYCQGCATYVPYLQSLDRSYCAVCGCQVQLFSQADWTAFNESLKDKKPKGGRRPRIAEDRESA
jgi:hypothetical protein